MIMAFKKGNPIDEARADPDAVKADELAKKTQDLLAKFKEDRVAEPDEWVFTWPLAKGEVKITMPHPSAMTSDEPRLVAEWLRFMLRRIDSLATKDLVNQMLGRVPKYTVHCGDCGEAGMDSGE